MLTRESDVGRKDHLRLVRLEQRRHAPGELHHAPRSALTQVAAGGRSDDLGHPRAAHRNAT
jgi:hypothetical protein